MAEGRAIAGVAAALVSLAGFVPYLAAAIRGRARPNRATWIIWTVVGGMLFASSRAAGAGPAAWLAASYTLGPFVTALVALRFGVGGWTRFDRACLAGALLGIGLWLATGSPTVALACFLAIDACGALPTVRKAARDPRSEDPLAWILFTGGNALDLLAVPRFTFGAAAFAIYMFAVAALVLALLAAGRLRARSRQHP